MHSNCLAKLVVLWLLLLQSDATNNMTCPMWTTFNTSTNSCQCGDWLGGAVQCYQDKDSFKVSLYICYCMTFDNTTSQALVGHCIYTCRLEKLLHDIADFQDYCEVFNRTGRLCGRCSEGYGLPVYSYSAECVPCSEADFTFNLFKFCAVAFFPLTVFFICVILLKVSATSGFMVAYIFICQLVTTPNIARIIFAKVESNLLRNVFFTLISFWNLDFFRSVYKPFCIHPHMTVMQVLALDYLIGVYPLFLILLTYLLVVLHDRYRIVGRMWRPAHRALTFIRKEWNIRESLVKAFATFLVLSYVKILDVSADLLTPVNIFTPSGKALNQSFLYSDAETVFFGPEHLPFALLAVAVSLVLNILPMVLLLVYPCHCFQACLNKCCCQTHVLHMTMDVFQGCYHHQPRDYRYFAGLYLFLRLLCLFTVNFFKDHLALIFIGWYIFVLSLALVVTQPYRKKLHNRIEIILFLLAAWLVLNLIFNQYIFSSEPQHFYRVATNAPVMITAYFPVIYGITGASYIVLPKKFLHQLSKRCTRKRKPSLEIPYDTLPQIAHENLPLLHEHYH